MYSRHGVISCPDVNVVCVFFFSLSLSLMNFQRSGGDFTVTFSDSYVSHYMWAGGREGGRERCDPSCGVVFLRNLLPTPPLLFSIRADMGVM